MRATALLSKRTAVLVIALAIGIGATACIPDTGPPPTGDPFQGPLLNAINQDRANNGLSPLTFSPKLAVLAGGHSCDMAQAQSLYHTDLAATINSSGYTAFVSLDENIVVGPAGLTPQQIEAAWMTSPPHRANILSATINVVGMNACTSSDGRVWATADFGAV
jgi:uncharacterized protein YkwD